MTTPFQSLDDFTFEGRMDNIRITKWPIGFARPGRFQRLRTWLHHRAPWLPRWVTGWTTLHFRKPEDANLLSDLCSDNEWTKFRFHSANYSNAFGEQSISMFDMSLESCARPVVEAVQQSAAVALRPGWHIATVTFKIDDSNNLVLIDEYKISSFGEDKPTYEKQP